MATTDASTGTTAHVAVVGAGLVGCLAALTLANKGYTVDVYEARSDPRRARSDGNLRPRSINLALSARGIEALASVGDGGQLLERVLKEAIPMKGRMIHPLNGETQSQDYGRQGEFINSIDRTLLNHVLLNDLDAAPNVTVHFRHKLMRGDFKRENGARLVFLARDTSSDDLHESDAAMETVDVDFVIGADGAYSGVRAALMKNTRTDFSQSYIDAVYVELSIPPGSPSRSRPQVEGSSTGATFLLDPNHLHIWPRHNFMLIALPNRDGSFTSTLFAPPSMIDHLTADEDDGSESIVGFFEEHFPDALKKIGRKALRQSWITNPREGLVSVDCNPYHFKDRVILIGDAAHSMVPFYGQGMNCGFEDVRVLANMLPDLPIPEPDSAAPPSDLENHTFSQRISSAFAAYTETRRPALVSICRLALHNYKEMSHDVVSPAYLIRKRVDGLLASIFPGPWTPLYEMVTFRADLTYDEVMRRRAWQDTFISRAQVGIGAVAGIAVGAALFSRLFVRS